MVLQIFIHQSKWCKYCISFVAHCKQAEPLPVSRRGWSARFDFENSGTNLVQVHCSCIQGRSGHDSSHLIELLQGISDQTSYISHISSTTGRGAGDILITVRETVIADSMDRSAKVFKHGGGGKRVMGFRGNQSTMSNEWEEGLTSNKMGVDRTFYMSMRWVGIGWTKYLRWRQDGTGIQVLHQLTSRSGWLLYRTVIRIR